MQHKMRFKKILPKILHDQTILKRHQILVFNHILRYEQYNICLTLQSCFWEFEALYRKAILYPSFAFWISFGPSGGIEFESVITYNHSVLMFKRPCLSACELIHIWIYTIWVFLNLWRVHLLSSPTVINRCSYKIWSELKKWKRKKRIRKNPD